MWTPGRKQEACIRAPLFRPLVRPDTRIIERPGWYQVITPSAPGNVLNEVALSQVDEADAERVIDETIAAYAAIDRPTKWCIGPWTRPSDLAERLARRGFRCWDMRGMVSDTALDVRPSQSPSIEEVGETNLDDYVSLMLRGWSLPPEQLAIDRQAHLETMRAPDRTAFFFLARDGAELLGTAWLILRGDYGYLVGAQVLEAARGRGLYRALIAARLAFLRARGVTLAVTQAREATSAPILQKLGFETVFRAQCWVSK